MRMSAILDFLYSSVNEVAEENFIGNLPSESPSYLEGSGFRSMMHELLANAPEEFN